MRGSAAIHWFGGQNYELSDRCFCWDDTDRRLIALLRENARVPVATLAHLLKVSRGTVQNRIDRLTADGVIGGFTVRLKPEAEPQRVRAITMDVSPICQIALTICRICRAICQ